MPQWKIPLGSTSRRSGVRKGNANTIVNLATTIHDGVVRMLPKLVRIQHVEAYGW